MKKFLIILFFCPLFPILTFSQETNRSFIYNYKGQLRVDTSLTITLKQYKAWCMAENNILWYLSTHVEYPILVLESRITGVVIISFDCDTSEIKNIKAEIKTGGPLDNVAIKGVEAIKEKILYEFTYKRSHKNKRQILYPGKYYIPIDFKLIDLKEYMKNNHTIPAIRPGGTYLSRYIE